MCPKYTYSFRGGSERGGSHIQQATLSATPQNSKTAWNTWQMDLILALCLCEGSSSPDMRPCPWKSTQLRLISVAWLWQEVPWAHTTTAIVAVAAPTPQMFCLNIEGAD